MIQRETTKVLICHLEENCVIKRLFLYFNMRYLFLKKKIEFQKKGSNQITVPTGPLCKQESIIYSPIYFENTYILNFLTITSNVKIVGSS
jgi:hypothetical protein